MPQHYPRFATLLVLAALVGCDGDGTGPEADIAVDIELSPPSVNPGYHMFALIEATAGPDEIIRRLVITASGAVERVDTIDVEPTASLRTSVSYEIPTGIRPVDFTLRVVAFSFGGSVTATAVAPVNDSDPPFISELVRTSPEGDVSPGDSVGFQLRAIDDVALEYAVVTVTGGVERVDTIDLGFVPGVVRAFYVAVPASAPFGAAFTVDVAVIDAAGRTTVADPVEVSIQDTHPPAVDGSLAAPTGHFPLVAGDQVTLSVDASDRHLVRIGYFSTGAVLMADSIEAADTSDALAATLTVDASWDGSTSFYAFGVDEVGNRTVSPIGSVFARAVVRPRTVQTTTFDGDAVDVAYDPARELAFISQGAGRRVLVVDVSPVQVVDSITYGSRIAGLDITSDNHYLVVALSGSRRISRVDLTSATWARANFDMVGIDGGDWPDRLRVASNGKAMVTLSFAGSGYGGSIWEFDVATGVSRRRNDVGIYGQVTERVPLAASADDHRILALIDDSCCPLEAMVYDATTDAWGPRRGTAHSFFPDVSADLTGSRFLIGDELYDDELHRVDGLAAPPGWSNQDAAALGSSGWALFATADGFAAVSTATGDVMTDVDLGFEPTLLRVLPDDGSVIAVSDGHFAHVILW